MLFDDTIILLFAKAPVAGYVNTRLIPDIGEQAATALQQELIHQRLAMLAQAELCVVHLMCAPDADHAFFRQCKQQYAVTLATQSEGNIGNRMSTAVRIALRRYPYVIVIGSDAPALDAGAIRQSITALRSGNDVVFVPAEDGGYVLVGLQADYPFLFEGIDWGSAAVMQQSIARLREQNVSWQTLATCWDIDRLEDYLRYQQMKDSKFLSTDESG